MKILQRTASADIRSGANFFPVVAILGPRQSGKTTLSKLIFKNHVYVTLEDLDLRAAAKNDPRSFLLANRNEHGTIIDEFQYVPELLSYIQTTVDQEQKNGFFILTGSQNFLMNSAITQSLAGRVSIHTLLPLSIQELTSNGLLDAEIESFMYKGGYPAIYTKHIPPEQLYKNYFQTYIERDVRQLAQVGDLTVFQTFITLCAARSGQILNLASLANECAISEPTAKRWISILQASYIIFLLHPHHTNFGKRLIKSPKIFFYDTGLACYLLRIKEHDLILHPARGGLFESCIISEILKWFYNHGKVPNIYFWQDKTGHEVDCLIEEGRTIIPIEMKAGRTTSQQFFEGLSYWNTLANQESNNGYVVYGGSASQSRGSNQVISWQNMETIFKQIP